MEASCEDGKDLPASPRRISSPADDLDDDNQLRSFTSMDRSLEGKTSSPGKQKEGGVDTASKTQPKRARSAAETELRELAIVVQNDDSAREVGVQKPQKRRRGRVQQSCCKYFRVDVVHPALSPECCTKHEVSVAFADVASVYCTVAGQKV